MILPAILQKNLILNKEPREKKNWKFRTNQKPEQLLPIAIFK